MKTKKDSLGFLKKLLGKNFSSKFDVYTAAPIENKTSILEMVEIVPKGTEVFIPQMIDLNDIETSDSNHATVSVELITMLHEVNAFDSKKMEKYEFREPYTPTNGTRMVMTISEKGVSSLDAILGGSSKKTAQKNTKVMTGFEE